jgi:cyanophycin synthetase
MKILDSRRLTGANLYWDLPAAILEIDLEGRKAEQLLAAWSKAASELLSLTGHGAERLNHRTWDDGIALLISAPVDALYSMCELNETAWACAVAEIDDVPSSGMESEQSRLQSLFDEEANPPLLKMQQAAADHDALFLWDDDEVSVGSGQNCQVWAPGEIPVPEVVEWQHLKSIPVAMVTGTNGKSTTVRMSASIISAAGISAGVTSTDFIRVGDTIIDHGDYSGTGGARTLIRHAGTQMAVLEVARGGLLRRGLGVPVADVAVIINVAADHLGEYGINTVPDLIATKFIVHRGLSENGVLILNADDAGIAAYAKGLGDDLKKRIRWFSLSSDNETVRQSLSCGGPAYVVRNGFLAELSSDGEEPIAAISEMPSALNGAARHNISNALAAVALTRVLGIGYGAIRQGLVDFQSNPSDNPGRGNWFEHRGVRILVDFAHNEHGVNALAEMVARFPATRRVLTIGQAGDRRDDEIAAMTRAACGLKPDLLMISRLPGYERGRSSQAVIDVIRTTALGEGLVEAAVSEYDEPVAAVRAALEMACEGDLFVFLALTQRDEVLALIREFQAG